MICGQVHFRGRSTVRPLLQYPDLHPVHTKTRSCIGWRFAVLELQAFVVALISHFEFSMTPEAHKVRREACLIMAPTIEGELDKGSRLPLLVRLAAREEA